MGEKEPPKDHDEFISTISKRLIIANPSPWLTLGAVCVFRAGPALAPHVGLISSSALDTLKHPKK